MRTFQTPCYLLYCQNLQLSTGIKLTHFKMFWVKHYHCYLRFKEQEHQNLVQYKAMQQCNVGRKKQR